MDALPLSGTNDGISYDRRCTSQMPTRTTSIVSPSREADPAGIPVSVTETGMEVCHGVTWCTLVVTTFTCRTVPNVALQQLVWECGCLEVAQPG